MIFLTIFLLMLGLAVAAFSLQRKNSALAEDQVTSRPDGCCGRHAACEHAGSRLAGSPCPADYYDDEELDRFRSRNANDYSEAEAAEFREALNSLAEGEAEQWLRSLERRGVSLPAALCNEAALIAGKERETEGALQ
jgi:hypothetical protein